MLDYGEYSVNIGLLSIRTLGTSTTSVFELQVPVGATTSVFELQVPVPPWYSDALRYS